MKTAKKFMDELASNMMPSEAMEIYARYEAIEFGKWIRDNTVADGRPKLLYRKEMVTKTTEQLYKQG